MTERRKGSRRRRPILWATLAAFAAGLVFTFAASTASLPGSNFEIDDGNLIVNNPAPAIDWASVNELRKADAPSGSTDDSFGQGAKEDTPVPTIVDGSIPPNKSDLLNMGFYLEENANGRFLNLFWHRVQEPQGTTNMDFEFNKSSTLSANGVTPVRTAGDVLIQYDLSQGGTNPQLFASRWVASGAGSQCEASNSTPCWGTRVNLTAAGVATGSINTSPIPVAESDGLAIDIDGNGTLDPISTRTFGEAQVDLDALTGGGAPACAVFGSAYLKSRSSDSFTSALKDFIAPLNLNIDQCGQVIIRKVTNPASNPANVQFGYTKSFNTDPAIPNTFTLGHGQSLSNSNVLFGSGYTVVEDVLPAGWDFQSLNCSASSGVTPSINGATVTFAIDDTNDILDCTYTNRARGTIIVKKITDDGAGAFQFNSNTLTPSPFTLTTVAAGEPGDSRTFADLPIGTYDVAEQVPAGWNLVSSTCSDGSPVSAIDLNPGETITCTFHDARQRGAILITKTRKHAADGPGNHPHAGVSFNVSGGSLPAGGTNVVTGSDGTVCLDGLVLSSHTGIGAYTVTETVPAGYKSDDSEKSVSVVAEATCAAGPKANVSFHNTPLTNVTLSVNSQVVGGTSSQIVCNGVNGSTGADGDGSVTLNDLEPTAPGVTVTCTVVVDP